MNVTDIISSSLNSLGRRILKVRVFGKDDIQTANEVSPFGFDSNPIEKMQAVYGKTAQNGDTFIFGYLNKNQNTDVNPGETRIFSLDENGNVAINFILRNDGTAELGGVSNFLVKFNELQTEFNELQSSHNQLVQAWNAFAGAYVPGGPGTQGLPATATSASQSNANIDNVKSDILKTI